MLGNAAMCNLDGGRHCLQLPEPDGTAGLQTGAAEVAHLDVQAVCEALCKDVERLNDLDVERFAETLSALVAAVDPATLRLEPPSIAASARLPAETADRLLFGCAIIFPCEDVDRVRAFVLRHLGTGGLLRLRLRPA